MTWLIDRHRLLRSGWLSSAYPGHGILGADVPNTGIDGPGPLYKQLGPEQAAVECRIVVDRSTLPAGITRFDLGEDGSLVVEGASGLHSVLAEVFFGGASQGTVALQFFIGDTALVLPENVWRVPAENRIWRAR